MDIVLQVKVLPGRFIILVPRMCSVNQNNYSNKCYSKQYNSKGYYVHSNMASYHGNSVNIEQVVIISSLLAVLHVPVKPPMKRILLSLIWTDLPSKYS